MRWLCFVCNVLLVNAQITGSNNKDITDNDINSTSYPQRNLSNYVQKNSNENTKPMFTDCETYKPEVKEEQPKNEPVIKVHAVDHDIDKPRGGNVTYKIVQRENERVHFVINENNGQIFTAEVFDRDEPTRQKELYLTVKATDDGRPALADICTFKVTITDVNDNSPIFDEHDYSKQVTEDMRVNAEVMRVLAYDYDQGENSRLTYSFINDTSGFSDYFKIDSNTGVVYLNMSLSGKVGTKFSTTVLVHDNGEAPKEATTEITITVISSDKQPPTILGGSSTPIEIPENFSDFDAVLANYTAESSVVFRLVNGKTIQTNIDQTFHLIQTGNTAVIKLARPLDYETVTEYKLTIRAISFDVLEASASLIIKVTDVNDEIPTFIELLGGSVVEDDRIGAQAMQVRAVDKDGTSPNNLVNYELLSHQNLFQINPETGLITASAIFDREAESQYHVLVRAYDKAPSALYKNKKEPNSAQQTFQINIEDRNDNPPKFKQPIYIVENIPENTDISKTVVEVQAEDKDGAAVIVYSIENGNVGDAFSIEKTTGRIKVKNNLDYETTESYTLTVKAFDEIYSDTCEVLIHIQNENDERPRWEDYNKTIIFDEETTSDDCIIRLTAYDPDIKDRNASQMISYNVAKDYKSFLKVDSTGCVTLIKKLDRDKPNGSPVYQAYVDANDNDGAANSLQASAEINIILRDINDNAPILNITEVVWNENEEPGKIVTLSAIDYDSEDNGPPFSYEISDTAAYDISEKFAVEGNNLLARTTFDRELQKMYKVPIKITDSGTPLLSGTSILIVTIGDKNDNKAEDGSSDIFVYKYEGLDRDIAIGRVYVNDADDWDLVDKIFMPNYPYFNDNFRLDPSNKGMIVMSQSTAPGTYHLGFIVTEKHLPEIEEHSVNANVTVIVKDIPYEAVSKSGSIRIQGLTAENFVEKPNEYAMGKKDELQRYIANILNVSYENVDVFTVLPSPSNSSLIDVRFSAHGSPYYAPERLNNKITEHQDALEDKLGVEFVMVSISECLFETACPSKYSCSNFLNVTNEPAVVFTNKTSFVGVNAVVEAKCDCTHRDVHECFNGGTMNYDGSCSCPEGFEGAHCEILGIGFNGDGWAMYPTFDACNSTDITLNILTKTDDGLIFYVGPLSFKHALVSKDFMSLELRAGYIVLKFDLGYGASEIRWPHGKLNDGKLHLIRISFTTLDIQIGVDDLPSDKLTWVSFTKSGLLNVNGPLQIGGLSHGFGTEQYKVLWGGNVPTHRGYMGCIRNFTYNNFMYNLGAPSDSYKASVNCNYGVMEAVTFGIDSNFLVAILVCVAILIILLLAVVVHRRKHDNLNTKDIDDTRENIINYEDEGGGEFDTNFDLSVLRPNLDEKPPIRDGIYGKSDVPEDISGFLDTKKHSCDKDPDNLPYDDVRHYGYEGDGNTSGSLSSLASCTDDGDLKFNYLSSFGPRFRKLADMYGDDASEEDSQNGGEESWC